MLVAVIAVFPVSTFRYGFLKEQLFVKLWARFHDGVVSLNFSNSRWLVL
jgi:hypothetical protein